MSTKPTVGRIVHYQSYGTPGGEYKPLPRAAVITAVDPVADFVTEEAKSFEGNYRVALCILNPTGQFFNTDVKFDPEGKPGSWRWPPRD